jgi:hypothetical protein
MNPAARELWDEMIRQEQIRIHREQIQETIRAKIRFRSVVMEEADGILT